MKTYQVATFPGDGIGKAVVPAGQEGLQDLAGDPHIPGHITLPDWYCVQPHE